MELPKNSKYFDQLCWGVRLRTRTEGTKIPSATITPHPNSNKSARGSLPTGFTFLPVSSAQGTYITSNYPQFYVQQESTLTCSWNARREVRFTRFTLYRLFYVIRRTTGIFHWCPRRESNPHGRFGPRDFLTTIVFTTRFIPYGLLGIPRIAWHSPICLWPGLYLNHIEILQVTHAPTSDLHTDSFSVATLFSFHNAVVLHVIGVLRISRNHSWVFQLRFLL